MLRKIIIFFIVFYAVGVVGILIPASRDFFIPLTPLALTLSALALGFHHRSGIQTSSFLVFSFILISGFFIEVLGVNSGLIFGEYQYGNALGFKWMDTPLMIGLNWLLLVYTSTSLIQRTKLNRWLGAILATALMLMYDILLEPVAPQIDMWTWANSVAPLQNYIAWGLIALTYHLLIARFRIQIRNPLDITIFFCQIAFFLFLYLFL